MVTKKELLNKLKNTYCRLGISQIHGVGVIAIRDIPKGTDPFFGIQKQAWIKLKQEDLKGLDSEIKRMLDDFMVTLPDGAILLNENGLNGMDISFFLNESKDPNVITLDEGDTFITKREIKKGEELTSNYSTYDFKHKNKNL